MAEAAQTPESEAPAAAAADPAELVVTLAEEKSAVEAPPPAPEAEEAKKPQAAVEPPPTEAAEGEGEKKKKKKGMGIPLSVYFKEETNVVEDLEDSQRKALLELRRLVQASLARHEFTRPPADAPKEGPAVVEVEGEGGKEVAPPKKPEESSPAAREEPAAATEEEEKAVAVDEDGAKTVEAIEETVVSAAPAATPPAPGVEDEEEAAVPVSLWGVPLVGDERGDTVLLKFLRARDFKVGDALGMLKDAVIWREEFGIEALLGEDLGVPELGRVVFMHGHDREGHPVCYNAYGELQDRELYHKAFADEERRRRFLRWRIQFLEKGIRELLDFSPAGACSMVQVTDLKNSPGPGRRELRQATNQALALLQDNYPEFVAKQVFINVPWWYLAFNRMMSPFFTQRTKSKFVFAGPSRSSETLFEYIAPEQVPVHYGGLSKKDDPDFSTSVAVTEFTIKPSTKHTVVIPAPEACLLVWELRVLGWEVSYGAEFVPSAEDGYTVIVHKARKFSSADEAFVKNSFKVGDPGKVVLTVDNPTSKKKKLLYRWKARKAAESV